MGSDISCFLMGFSFVWVHIAQVHWADDGQSRHPDHMSHIAATAQKFQSLTSKQRDIDRCKSSKLHALRDEKLDGERKSRCQTETATDITFAALEVLHVNRQLKELMLQHRGRPNSKLRNAENCCISMTESDQKSSGQGHHALETSSRRGGVFREILSRTTSSEHDWQEESKKSRQRSGQSGRATTCEKKLSARVNASEKVKDSTSILTAKRGIRANTSYNCSFENELFPGKEHSENSRSSNIRV